jgi:NAD+ synthase (glutamine-hydrolysing)
MKDGFVKCGAFTPEIKVGDTIFNAKQIVDGVTKASNKGVKILAFPELCLTGATLGDFVANDMIANGVESGLKYILDNTKNAEVLFFVGVPLKVKEIYDTVAVIYGGEILAFVAKKYIDRLEVKQRCFTPYDKENTVIDYLGKQIPLGNKFVFTNANAPYISVGVEIGSEGFLLNSPSISLVANGANLIVNCSSIAHVVGKESAITSQLKAFTQKAKAGYLYAESGYGESTTDEVYSAQNGVYELGKCLKSSTLFENGLICATVDFKDIESERVKVGGSENNYQVITYACALTQTSVDRVYSQMPFVPTEEKDIELRTETVLRMQAEGLKKRLAHTNAKTVVLGLSGGLDSTLALIVCVKAFELMNKPTSDIIAVTMPCFGTTGRTFNNSVALAKGLKVTLKTVNIAKSVTRHLKDLKHPLDLYDVTFENAQARERTQVLMDMANMYGGLVVGTGDLSELALGWATYNGDHMSMYAVNAGVPKTLIRYIVSTYAKTCKPKLKAVLLDILDTPISPELLPANADGNIAQKTEDIVGPYLLHDFYMYYLVRKGFSPLKTFRIAKLAFGDTIREEVLKKWLKNFVRRFFTQQFKRNCLPDGVKIGTVALSPRGALVMPSDMLNTLWQQEVDTL